MLVSRALRTRVLQAMVDQRLGARYLSVSLRRALEPKQDPTAMDELREGSRSQVHFRLTPNRHPLNIDKKKDNQPEPTVGHVWQNPVGWLDFHLNFNLLPSGAWADTIFQMLHAVWTPEDLAKVQETHVEPQDKGTFSLEVPSGSLQSSCLPATSVATK